MIIKLAILDNFAKRILHCSNVCRTIRALHVKIPQRQRNNLLGQINYGKPLSSEKSCWKSYTTEAPYSDWTEAQTEEYIRAVTEVSRAHLTPEVGLHLVTPRCPLWAGRGEDCLVPDPFWAFYWPGGQALTRYILDHPGVVRGRRVLDVGSGCGASAITAVMSGASEVIANDICPVAAAAIKLNSLLNNVTIETDTRNLIGMNNGSWDVIFLGDMFYDEEFTNYVTGWLEEMHSKGKDILIGDPGRVYLKNHPIKGRLKPVFSVDLMQHTMGENYGITQGFVWKFID